MMDFTEDKKLIKLLLKEFLDYYLENKDENLCYQCILNEFIEDYYTRNVGYEE